MRPYRFIALIDTMEEVPVKELQENAAGMMKTISEKNTGFRIKEGGQDAVLCPAWWFDYILDDDFGCVVNSAIRYAIGRHTYMPSVIIGFIRKYMMLFSSKVLLNAERDIEEYLRDTDTDSEGWHILLGEIKERLEQLAKTPRK